MKTWTEDAKHAWWDALEGKEPAATHVIVYRPEFRIPVMLAPWVDEDDALAEIATVAGCSLPRGSRWQRRSDGPATSGSGFPASMTLARHPTGIANGTGVVRTNRRKC